MCQPRYRVLSHHYQRITVAVPRLLTEQFLTERNFISHNVITDASQLIAKRFGSKACIRLRYLAIIVAPKLLTVSARQMGGLDECPAQIPVTIFAIAMTFAFAG